MKSKKIQAFAFLALFTVSLAGAAVQFTPDTAKEETSKTSKEIKKKRLGEVLNRENLRWL